MKTAVIMDEQEWERYRRTFAVAANRHTPSIPPSFPVVVLSTPSQGHVYQIGGEAAYQAAYQEGVEHCFIEQRDLRRLLGLPEK